MQLNPIQMGRLLVKIILNEAAPNLSSLYPPPIAPSTTEEITTLICSPISVELIKISRPPHQR